MPTNDVSKKTDAQLAKAAKKQNAKDLKSLISQLTAGVKKDNLSLSGVLQKLGLQSASDAGGGAADNPPANGSGGGAGGSGGGSGGSGGSSAPDTTASDLAAKTDAAAAPGGFDWKIAAGIGLVIVGAVIFLMRRKKKNG